MRTIDAEALRKAWKKKLDNAIGAEQDGMYACLELIDNAPTVEPNCPYLSDNEVKQPCLQAPCERPHGKWLVNTVSLKCSVCNHSFFDSEENMEDYNPITDLNFNYCPNCGADMRGDANDG